MTRREFLAAVASPVVGARNHTGCLYLENASTRAALDMVFHAYDREYVLTVAVGGWVSLVAERVSFEEQVAGIVARSTIPVNYSVENGVYIFDSPIPVRAEDTYTIITQDCQPAPLPLEAVFRRVSGLRFERGRKGAIHKQSAIFLLDSGSGADEFIVSVGDRVPSGAPGFHDLQVVAIRGLSVDLETIGTDQPKRRLRVFMRNRGIASKR